MAQWDALDDDRLAGHEQEVADQLAEIYRHLGEYAPDPEAPLHAVYRHEGSGSMLFAIEEAFYAYREGAGVRYRPLGEGMMEMMARRQGRLIGSAVVPQRSVFPAGLPEEA